MQNTHRHVLSAVVFCLLSTLLYLSAPAGCGNGLKHPELCGNGALDEGEDCDDGNNAAGDGCSVDCDVEALDEGEGEDDPPVRCSKLSDCDSLNKDSECVNPAACQGYYVIAVCEDGICQAQQVPDDTICEGMVCDPDTFGICGGDPDGSCGSSE